MDTKVFFFLTILLDALVLLHTGYPRIPSSPTEHLSFDVAKEKLGNITASMRSSGYRAMADVLDNNLEGLLNECGFMRRGITIFAPRDEAMGKDKLTSLSSLHKLAGQIVQWRVDDEDPWSSRVVVGRKLHPSCQPCFMVRITRGFHGKGWGKKATINQANVVDWGIYNDEHVAVHGVDRLFAQRYNRTCLRQDDGIDKLIWN
ncbi:hypothetical protein MLD38_007194 [Melastoma candidum]|uniref:Uncharacterized protein n=1 Tax=Melastoma candidum TaxID=119954 RepID=A0ACB9RRP4_9MYRT|nr:hypothetical protein MLD38_007194 [Melastoma candidum]